ncbi:hypothetical protein [Cellulomonas composti]|uniref:Aerotolerance regulator N-terminal domain-containing protein n=1 Tax=Cellulomonas composti TaxID=266130 RepID=A0A511JBV6_9CELL|nr:hypothetical protein [Cellulomonas composti]GEL95471.1 hypothetical protein CCO02nite_21290 [Cellulomonas composti]
MTFFLILVAPAVVWTAARLVITIRRDGLGTRVPPPSRPAWSDAVQHLPSHRF